MTTILQNGSSEAVPTSTESAAEAIQTYLSERGRIHMDYVRLNKATGEIQLKMYNGFKVVIQYDSARKDFNVLLC